MLLCQYCGKNIASFRQLWHFYTNKTAEIAERAARVFTFSNYNADTTELFEFLGWKNLARQQEMRKVPMVFKCLHRLQ